MGHIHVTLACREPSLPGRSGTDSTARDALDAADLHGRLGLEDATATEARFARPNVQVPGDTVHDHPNAARQNAGEVTTRDGAMDTGEGATMTVKELIAKINLIEKRHEGKDQEQMDCMMAVLGADPKSSKREKRRAV